MTFAHAHTIFEFQKPFPEDPCVQIGNTRVRNHILSGHNFAPREELPARIDDHVEPCLN